MKKTSLNLDRLKTTTWTRNSCWTDEILLKRGAAEEIARGMAFKAQIAIQKEFSGNKGAMTPTLLQLFDQIVSDRVNAISLLVCDGGMVPLPSHLAMVPRIVYCNRAFQAMKKVPLCPIQLETLASGSKTVSNFGPLVATVASKDFGRRWSLEMESDNCRRLGKNILTGLVFDNRRV